MDKQTSKVLKKFATGHDGFKNDIRGYLETECEQGNLNHEQLNYLYDNLYKNKNYYINQNIYPVSQMMIKDISIETINQLTVNLEDATEAGILFAKYSNKGDPFNKICSDIVVAGAAFSYKKSKGYDDDPCINFANQIIETTTINDRIEMMDQIYRGYIIDFENIEGIRERELEDEMEM